MGRVGTTLFVKKQINRRKKKRGRWTKERKAKEGERRATNTKIMLIFLDKLEARSKKKKNYKMPRLIIQKINNSKSVLYNIR